jgi:hypothetical protein
MTQTHSKMLTTRRKKQKTSKHLAAVAKRAKKLVKKDVTAVSAGAVKKVNA